MSRCGRYAAKFVLPARVSHRETTLDIQPASDCRSNGQCALFSFEAVVEIVLESYPTTLNPMNVLIRLQQKIVEHFKLDTAKTFTTRRVLLQLLTERRKYSLK